MTREANVNPMAGGVLLAVVAAVTFGATTPLVQRFGHGVGPFSTGALLYAGAALASAPWSLRAGSAEAPLGRQHVPRLLVVALVGGVFAPACLAWGLQHTTGTTASLLLNFEAVFTVLLGWRLYHEPVSVRLALSVLAMLAGGASLVLAQSAHSSGLGLGALVVVGAALGWALDNALTRPLADLDPVQVVRWKATLGATFGLALAVALKQPFPSLGNVAGLLGCGAVGYGLSLRFYLLAQRRVGAGRTGSIFALAPFVGAAVAWIMGERGDALPTVGAALLFGTGVYLHLREKHDHAHAHEPMMHDHAHRHDDDHHDHAHEPPVTGEHSHVHRHEARQHVHPHGSDVHHQHRHS